MIERQTLSDDARSGRKRGDASSLQKISPIGLGLLYFGAFVLAVAGLRAASGVIVPFILATFLSVVCAPVLDYLQRRLTFPVALTVILLGLAAAFAAIPIVIGGSFQQLLTELPSLQRQLASWEASLSSYLRGWDLEVSSEDVLQAFDPAVATQQLYAFLNGVLRIFGDGVIVLIMTGLMLTEAAWFSAKVSAIDASGDVRSRVQNILGKVRRYLGIKTVVSLATGLSVWVGLLALGVDYALVWAFVAFFLNYVPTIGSILAGVPPVLLALVQQSLGVAVMVAILYVVVNQLFGSVIEPRLQGHGLGLSPLVVFLSFVFWGWVFGPVGMLLSAPITMALKVTLEAFPETQWIAIMLGGKPLRPKEV